MEMRKNAQENFDPIPNFQYGAWRGKVSPNPPVNALLDTFVKGPNRCKYFSQPLASTYKEQEQIVEEVPWWKVLQEPEPIQYVNVGTQTIFRESETQTDPWDPPYKLKKDVGTPEILTIASLSYDKGLPVSDLEVDEILRARGKREWEASLPPITDDESQMKERHMMIVKQKVKEFNYVKEKIRKKHEMKLAWLESILSAKIQERKKQKEMLLKTMWASKKAQLQKNAWKLHRNAIKLLQKVKKNKSVLSDKFCDNSLAFEEFEESSSFSESSVPQSKFHQVPSSDHFYLESAKGLVELEKWLWEEQKIVMEPEIYGPKRDVHPTRLQKIIEQAEREISKQKGVKPIHIKAEKKFAADRPQSRPATPSVPNVQQEVLDRDCALVYLQKVLHGRALQKEVLEVQGKYIALIKELKKAQDVPVEEKVDKIAQYKKQKIKSDQASTRYEVLSRFEGKVISDALNIFGKAVNRSQSVKQVEDFVLKAKDVRRRRECEESGRRQKEVLQQKILDKMFSQIYRTKEE